MTRPAPVPWWLCAPEVPFGPVDTSPRTGGPDRRPRLPWWLRRASPEPWWLRPMPGTFRPASVRPDRPKARARAASPPPRLARPPERLPLSAQVLRLKTVRLRGWQRVLLFEGTFAIAVVIALADFATAWLPVVVPFAVAAMLKLHDVVLTRLHRNDR